MSRAQWLAARPAVTSENERVLAVWQFCGGWNPPVLPMAAAYYGVTDPDFLLEQLLAVRQAVDAYQAAQREANP